MKLPTPKISTIAITISVAAVVAVTCAQHLALPGKMETVIRRITDGFGLFAAPILIVLAYRGWARNVRPELPAWRNGLGLSSMVVVSLVWLLHTGTSTFILGSIWRGPTLFFGLEWIALLLSSNLAGLLLAIALRGGSRIQAIAAALLVWAYLESSIYF